MEVKKYAVYYWNIKNIKMLNELKKIMCTKEKQ
jgi:hypothetical protein